MGQPRHAHERAGAVPPGDDDRSFRERHRDGAQREKAVPRHQAGHRYTCAGGCLCVRHLRHGDGRRRSLGRLQGRRRALGRAGNSDRRGRVLRFQETRRPYRRPDDVRPCHRHARAGPGARVGAASGHHGARRCDDRRVQHPRRVLACGAAVRRTRLAHRRFTLGRRAFPRSADHASRQSVDGGVLERAAQRRAQAQGTVGCPVFRRQFLRHDRYLECLARVRPAAR